MLQNIHSSRAVLAGIVFCVLIVGGSLIYSWYIRRTTVTAPTPSDALLHQRENQNEARTTADTIDPNPVDFEQPETLLESEYIQTNADDPGALPSNDAAPGGGNSAHFTADQNPVPPEVIEDSERDLEWIRADREWVEKYRALEAERDKLRQEGKALRPPATPESIQRALRMSDDKKESHIAALKALMKKSKDLEGRIKRLQEEKPIRPTPTHTH